MIEAATAPALDADKAPTAGDIRLLIAWTKVVARVLNETLADGKIDLDGYLADESADTGTVS